VVEVVVARERTEASLHDAFLSGLIHAIVVQIVPDAVGMLVGGVWIHRIGQVHARVEEEPTPGAFDHRLAVAEGIDAPDRESSAHQDKDNEGHGAT
jgi:hypothetical protein